MSKNRNPGPDRAGNSGGNDCPDNARSLSLTKQPADIKPKSNPSPKKTAISLAKPEKLVTVAHKFGLNKGSALAKRLHKQFPKEMAEAFATEDVFLLLPLLIQAKCAGLGGERPETDRGNHLYVVGALKSIGPRDGVETLLAVQMVATHSLAMRCLDTAAREGQTAEGREAYFNLGNRYMRTFTFQMEALKRHRSTGEQHCKVEHVHVHSGGQAVVGNLNAGGQGRQRLSTERQTKVTRSPRGTR